MHTAYNSDLAARTTRRTTPVPDPHQSALRRMCHLYSAGLPPQRLFELQFRDRLCIDTRIVPQPIMPGFYGSAHLGHRCVHSHPHRVAARLQFCSANLNMFLHKLGIVGAGRNVRDSRSILRSWPRARTTTRNAAPAGYPLAMRRCSSQSPHAHHSPHFLSAQNQPALSCRAFITAYATRHSSGSTATRFTP